MTDDPTQPQPSPFPAPEPGSAPGQPAAYPPTAYPPAAGQTSAPAGQPTYAPLGQPSASLGASTAPSAQPPFPPAGQPAPQPAQPVVPSFIPPSVASAAANPRRNSAMSGLTMALIAGLVIAAGGLGFAGGRLTAPAAATTPRGQFGQNGGNFPGGNFPGGSFAPNASGIPNRGNFGGGFGAGNVSIDGQVTAIANGSITVQTANGQSVTLQVPSTVTYHAQAPATSSDVTVGSNVQVSVGGRIGRPDGSGQPAASGQPLQGGPGFNFSVTDITVLGK